MDGVERRAAQLRAEQEAAAALDRQRRQDTAQAERNRRALERARQQRMGEILGMSDRQRKWLLLPGDRKILHEVRDMEWYNEAGARIDDLIDTFRQWATENDIPTNVTVGQVPDTFRRPGRPAPEEFTSGWMIYSHTRTWNEDVTPAWDRFPRSEARSSTQYFFVAREPQSQGPYYADRALSNLRVTPYGPRDGVYDASINPQRAPLPTSPNDAALYALERNLEQGMALWVVANPSAPWPPAA